MRRVVIVGFDDAELLDIACPADVFDSATRWGADPPYQVELTSLGGRPIVTTSGITLAAGAVERVTGRLDTVIVSGGLGHRHAAEDARLLTHLRRLAGQSRRIASVCTGATLLAAAGLLDGRRATTHWMWAEELSAGYPAVTVDPAPLFVADGNVHTSAGVTSALDLTLALVEDDHGPRSRAVWRGRWSPICSGPATRHRSACTSPRPRRTTGPYGRSVTTSPHTSTPVSTPPRSRGSPGSAGGISPGCSRPTSGPRPPGTYGRSGPRPRPSC